MTQKILNVKNILRIMISVLIIFSMLKSCARAANLTKTLTKTPYTENMLDGYNVYDYLVAAFQIEQDNTKIWDRAITWQQVRDNFYTSRQKIFYINGNRNTMFLWRNNDRNNKSNNK